MGVQLNIKDAETVRLARKLADDSGQSVTAAIRTALERELRVRAEDEQQRYDRITAILADFGLPPEWEGKTSKELMDAIYDEDGLPI